MKRKPELLILAGLLVAAMAFVLWYVVDRRAKLRAHPPTALTPALAPGQNAAPVATAPASSATLPATPAPAPKVVAAASQPAPAGPVDVPIRDGQTLDFSSGKPVVKNAAEDKAAIDAAMKDIASAEKEVTFEAPKKDPAPKKD